MTNLKRFNKYNLSKTICFLFIGLVILAQPVLARELPDFTDLVNENSAAVVNISTVLKKPAPGEHSPGLNIPDIPEDHPFYDFFRRFFGEIPEGIDPFQERSSLGSGFIISRDGYVITNHHVIKDADEIIVRMNDRQEHVAELIGSDERTDIAVLKIDANNLPALKLGDSSRLKVGEWVLAIGSPFGFDYSVTQGIVSAMGRSLPNENYVPFIQTDVAINPGNSGGPLFNLDGEVVGVNSQIYSRTGGFMGLSFAVPINVVSNVYQQIIEKGHVSRGWLGVLIQDVTRELAESFGMDKPHGALVAKVLPDSPAEKAGFEVGDVITDYDNKSISFSSDLPPLVGSSPIGEKVPVKIIRRGKTRVIQIVIAELPEDNVIAGTGKIHETTGNILNITVQDLTDKQREDYELKDHGVLVTNVNPGPGREAGIIRGDILMLINNIKIKDVKHFNKILDELPRDKSIPLLVQRRGGPIFLALKVTE